MKIASKLVWELLTMTIEPEGKYHNRPETSTSQIKDYFAAPEQYHARVIAKTMPAKSSPSMAVGTAVHEDILSAAITSKYVVIPDNVLSQNGSRAGGAWKEFAAENEGRLLLKQHEAEYLEQAIAAIRFHPVAADVLSNGFSEQTLVFRVSKPDGEHLLDYRMRLDYVKPGESVADIKTTSDIDDRRMLYAIRDFCYGEQAAAYKFGADLAFDADHEFVFVMTHTKPPMMARIWKPKHQTLQAGFDRIEDAILEICERRKSGNWFSDDWLSVREF